MCIYIYIYIFSYVLVSGSRARKGLIRRRQGVHFGLKTNTPITVSTCDLQKPISFLRSDNESVIGVSFLSPLSPPPFLPPPLPPPPPPCPFVFLPLLHTP